ncbi:MAG: SDR family NAD(P)-dependent oxidoreductase [Deltaproteobacteria bacterium]|nr:SDR family NAD(P)-dependent oxidoreductase [Deltaproteobacteria bacterium]
MSDARWTAHDLPDLSGRTIVVTGANSGLGFETTRALAHRGAHVIMGCRRVDAAREAARRIEEEGATGRLEPSALDLADLSSIEAFADRVEAGHDCLDALCNNAGVMALPYAKTADGFEMQLGINHLGHYALTGHLLSLLLAADGSRVVTVSSLAHRMGRMDWEDLQGERRYRKWMAYGQSKLANLLFTFELQRRLGAAQRDTLAAACHPGYAATNLQDAGARQSGAKLRAMFMRGMNRVAAQSAMMGSLPSLYALFGDDVRGGDFIGPDGAMQMRGYPTQVEASAHANDTDLAAELWAVSQRLTGVRYDALSN